METLTLYRPVGPKELELIKQSGFAAFPPRLFHQPIFYPVMNEEYATMIARDWNVKESGSGYVTRFQVNKNYVPSSRSRLLVARSAKSFGCQLKNWKSSIETLWAKLKSLLSSNEIVVAYMCLTYCF